MRSTHLPSVTSRHDKIANLLINFFNSNLFLARTVKKAFAHKLPDVEIHLPRETIFIDVSGTHPFNPSYLERTLTNISSALDNRANTSPYTIPTCLMRCEARGRGQRSGK